MTDNQTVKKNNKKRQFIAYAFFALLGWEIAIVFYCIFEVCDVHVLGWWCFSGFPGAHGISAHQQSWDLHLSARLPRVFPFEDPGVNNFARLSTVCTLAWVKFGKFQAKMMMTLVRVRLRENIMLRLKYSYRHFPEKLWGSRALQQGLNSWHVPTLRSGLYFCYSHQNAPTLTAGKKRSVCQCVP